eukprot:scaffold47798_cov47-Phaeocystis_antarctica.AAC.2
MVRGCPPVTTIDRTRGAKSTPQCLALSESSAWRFGLGPGASPGAAPRCWSSSSPAASLC